MMDTFKKFYIRIVFCLIAVDVILASNPNQPEVVIRNGATVIGRTNTTVDQNKTYYTFRAIPFAEPPIGELRFKPPVPLSGDFSQQIINASDDSPPCVQTALSSISVIGSEDCLYLNVYTPQLPGRNVPLLPVMVWIYGGGFFFGDSSYATNGPDYFLDDQGVIIVGFNYRLGIFGFLSTGDNASPGNYGLKDQVAALKWVQGNIQYFGGDPGRVTIFGQSAGSAAVSYLTQTPLTQGLFKGAIMESGTSLCLWALTRNPKSNAVVTATALNIDVSTSQILVDGLRSVDYVTLQTASTAYELEPFIALTFLNGLPFGPTIEPPGPDAIVVNNSYVQLQNGLFHHIPYIIGYNSLEAIGFQALIQAFRLFLLRYDVQQTALVPASMNINNHFIKPVVNSIIKLQYFGLAPVTFSDNQMIQFISDDEFNRPILENTILTSQYSPNTYLYRFSYQGSLGSGNTTQPGVGHAEEIPYFWIIPNQNYATQSDLLTRARLIRLWTNFAKTGNPTPVSDPLLEGVTWPLANQGGAGNLAYLDINTDLTPGINPNWTNFIFWNNLFNEFGVPPYSTY